MMTDQMIRNVEEEWDTLVSDLTMMGEPLPKDQMRVFAFALESLLNQAQSIVDTKE